MGPPGIPRKRGRKHRPPASSPRRKRLVAPTTSRIPCWWRARPRRTSPPPAQSTQAASPKQAPQPSQAQTNSPKPEIHAEASDANQAAQTKPPKPEIHAEASDANQAAQTKPPKPEIHAEASVAKQAAQTNPPKPEIQAEASDAQQAAPSNPQKPRIQPAAALANPDGAPVPSKSQPKRLLPTSKAKAKEQDEEHDPGDKPVDPPAQVNKATLMKRLARLCAPREDGTYKIPLDVIDTYKNLSSRDEVYRSFEKCGCDPVPLPRLKHKSH